MLLITTEPSAPPARALMSSLPLRLILAGFAGLLAAGCDSPSGAEPEPASIGIVSGENQQGTAGVPLAQPLVVRVLDEDERAAAGAEVTWTVVSGGGTVSPATSTVASDGTASTSWTLGSLSGPEVVRATVGTLAPAEFTATSRGAGRISLHVRLPAPNAVVGDTVFVAAQVLSTPASVNSFTAQVQDRVVNLTPAAGESQGKVPLVGLPSGNYVLRVRAGATNGDSGVAVVNIIRDLPPRLTITSPAAGTVARPDVRIDADCTDDAAAGCVSLIAYALVGNTLTQLVTGTTGLHQSVSLAAYTSPPVNLVIRATDSRGQMVADTIPVFVESNPSWTELAAAGRKLLDINDQYLLYVDSTFGVWRAARGGGGATKLYQSTDTIPAYFGRLHPTGAIFADDGHGFDWRGGMLEDLGAIGVEMTAAGNWAIWWGTSGHTNLYRRNLTTGATLLVATDAQNNNNDVATNGDVVYTNASMDIVRYRDGVSTLLTDDDDATFWNYYPRTDGINVVFQQTRPCCGDWQARVARSIPGGKELLTDVPPPGYGQLLPEIDYRVNNGWIAFRRHDAGGVLQIWTRSPTGELRQVTNLTSQSHIPALRGVGPNGEVAYFTLSATNRISLELPPYTAAPLDVGAQWDRIVEWRDGALVVILGRSAFLIDY